MANSIYSIDVSGIKDATAMLIDDNAETLIRSIYLNSAREPYDKPDVRVGLVVKILIKSSRHYSADLLRPVVEDIEQLLVDDDYLYTFKNPAARKEGLSKELSLVNKFIELDDTLSLNTLNLNMVPGLTF